MEIHCNQNDKNEQIQHISLILMKTKMVEDFLENTVTYYTTYIHIARDSVVSYRKIWLNQM